MFKRLSFAALTLALLAGCQLGPDTDYEVATLVLPEGHPQAGREVFLQMGCASCHRVSWETGLPAPISATAAPELDEKLATWSAGGVVTAIIAPSYHRSDEYRLMARDEVSGMGDFTEAMTVRQLLDLTAYLRAQGSETVAKTQPGAGEAKSLRPL